MTRTFADSFYLLALFNPRDAAHDRALSASRELQGTLVTPDWVLTETADALCHAVNRHGCAQFIDDLRRWPRVEIEPVPARRDLMPVGTYFDNVWTRTGR